MLSSFFWGYIITQLPGGYLATKYGGKNLFGGGVVLTAILALISPPSARVNEKFFITIRILQGLCEVLYLLISLYFIFNYVFITMQLYFNM